MAQQLPISGRYSGEILDAPNDRDFLDLRIDIDAHYSNSQVMNKISGDFYKVTRISLPGRLPEVSRTYLESWIVDTPEVKEGVGQVEITGVVRFWQESHTETTIRIIIDRGARKLSAEVKFSEQAGDTWNYTCPRQSDCFRDMNLEVAVCESAVNKPPILPTYKTDSHSNRPADLPVRDLTIKEAYQEAGVCMTMRPEHVVIDDSDPEFATWSAAELHDAMEKHFGQIAGEWPKWEMWGLLAGTYEESGVVGIMFDVGVEYGGAGKPPERQGFAVFREHEYFQKLPQGSPQSDAEAEALRYFLFAWVHEAGHAFNYLHSWDKGRPDTLSWMNYDWKYEQRNGTGSFWKNFEFRFDDEELVHLRHGARSAVIMGGDPWGSSSAQLQAPGALYPAAPRGTTMQVEGHAPLEFRVNSKEYFEFLEPVMLELRLRNMLNDLPVIVDPRLHPEYGNITLYIRRPDGRTLHYSPLACKFAVPQTKVLEPIAATALDESVLGKDRHSEEVLFSYGKHGFYFDTPGEYLVRAVYEGPGDLAIPSNLHRLRIGNPVSKYENRLAQDFFRHEVGMALYLKGSRSPSLVSGFRFLEDLQKRYEKTIVGAKLASVVANSYARPFFTLELTDKPRRLRLIKLHEADLRNALAVTGTALKVHRGESSKPLNIAYHKLVDQRADLLTALGEPGKAKTELETLFSDLGSRGVRRPVLEGIKARAEEIGKSAKVVSRNPRTRRPK